MDEIQFIVLKLNQPPFEKGLTLVDFDGKQPHELLQLAIDVFANLDSNMQIDVREVTSDQLVAKLSHFLSILKFKIPPDEDRDRYLQGLCQGEKSVIYPLLHWVLQRLPMLTKRAYLARFLVRVEIPPEFLQDEALLEIFNSYRTHQEQFIQAHKQVDQLRSDPSKKAEKMKAEIATLEDEKKQLQMKIERFKKQTKDEPGFKAIYEATSKLRQQQDEDSRLCSNMRKQRLSLQHVQDRQEDAGRRLKALRSSQQNNSTAEAMLAELLNEVSVLEQRARVVLPRELEQERCKREKLEELRFEPKRSQTDLEMIQHEVQRYGEQCAKIREQVDDNMNARADNKLTTFRQALLLASKKLAAKEEEVELLQHENRQLAEQIDSEETKLSDMGGNQYMTKSEFKNYGVVLREKTQRYRDHKTELKDLQAESVLLHRTEQILRGRDKNLGEFLTQLEAKKGVLGYRATQEKLEKASEEAANLDANKEQTLEEISAIVKGIKTKLHERKNQLAPQIKQLREVRKVHNEVESEYNYKKMSYDKVAVGLEMERQQLEQKCEEHQKECLEEESRYHYLNCLLNLEGAALQRIENEDKWERGDGCLMPNFKTYQALYKDKVSRQQVLTEQLRKSKASISGNESSNMKQRELFAGLHTLLQCKLQASTGSKREEHVVSASEFDMMNGAKIMKIDQT